MTIKTSKGTQFGIAELSADVQSADFRFFEVIRVDTYYCPDEFNGVNKTGNTGSVRIICVPDGDTPIISGVIASFKFIFSCGDIDIGEGVAPFGQSLIQMIDGYLVFTISILSLKSLTAPN